MATAAIGKRYRHYKNEKEYTVLHIAHHTETDETLVIYQAEYGTEDLGSRPIFARPKEMFEEQVEIEGGLIDRFTEL